MLRKTNMKKDALNDYRCDCGKLLFKSSGLSGKIEIKCNRCGKIKAIGAEAGNFLLRDAGVSLYGNIGTGNKSSARLKKDISKRRDSEGEDAKSNKVLSKNSSG